MGVPGTSPAAALLGEAHEGPPYELGGDSALRAYGHPLWVSPNLSDTKETPMKRFRDRSLRLPYYDYSQGSFFITIVCKKMIPFFGEIRHGSLYLNDAGNRIEKLWQNLPDHFSGLSLGPHVLMPNHFHAVLSLDPIRSYTTLGTIIGTFKSQSTHRYIQGVKQYNWKPFPGKLWQENYYEHIIRNEADHMRIEKYIANNPLKWELDRFYCP